MTSQVNLLRSVTASVASFVNSRPADHETSAFGEGRHDFPLSVRCRHRFSHPQSVSPLSLPLSR